MINNAFVLIAPLGVSGAPWSTTSQLIQLHIDLMATTEERQEELPKLRAQFSRTLSLSDDTLFLRMLWALNALQTGRAERARPYLQGYPPDARAAGIAGKNAIYPWELETLANELFTTPKDPIYRVTDCRSWNSLRGLVNLLRALENAEYGAHRHELSVFVEMGRIGARQFPWQRGHFGIPQLYRNVFVYGQGECAAYLRESSGLTASDMTLVGFCLLSVFYSDPTIRPASDLELIHDFGIDRAPLIETIARIARPLAHVRSEAARLRQVNQPTAYRPSVLRQYPCILVGHRTRTAVAPLPDLIMDRVTNGLFYDVIGGGGPVRDEIGRRFEQYSFALLTQMLAPTRFLPETTYRTRLGPIATPDVLMVSDAGDVHLAVECKASRMGAKARFGELPEEDRGYEELAKGVMQLWRFFAHCRAQIAPHRSARDAQAMILTMDEWFAGRSTVIPRIMERANELADASAQSAKKKQ
jgi:hypothetical protein